MNLETLENLALYKIPVALEGTVELGSFLAPYANTNLNAAGLLHLWISKGIPDFPFTDYLNESEKIRMQKLKIAEQRHWFSYSRSLLRMILSRYTGILPQEIRFEYGPNGKPAIAMHQNTKNIHFNLSHSNGYFACAIGYMEDIGVDVEHVAPNPKQVSSISKSFYFPEEAAVIESAGEPEAYFLFYKYWTIKEAGIKANGQSVMQIKESPSLSHLTADEAGYVTPLAIPGQSGFTSRIGEHTYLAAIWCSNKYQGL